MVNCNKHQNNGELKFPARCGLRFIWRRLYNAFVASTVAVALGACANTPQTYEMSEQELVTLRSDLGKIGVVMSQYPAKLKFATPARGGGGGAGKGFVAGFTLPILIGFVAPVPGGTLVGVIVAPFTGFYGAFTGAGRARSAEDVDRASDGIRSALARLQRQHVAELSLEGFVSIGEQRTPYVFEALPDIGPQERGHEPIYADLVPDDIDTVLEIRTERAGLWGMYDVDPPSVAFIDVRVNLIRVHDNKNLVEDDVTCMGEKRSYDEWGDDNGMLFYNEMLACIPRLQEKIIDDLFLVYRPAS